MYIKLSRNSSAEYYQENKERLQKKLIKDSKIFLEKKETKKKMVVNITRISQKMKKKSLVSIEKNIVEWEKMPYHNYKKVL